MKKKLCFLAVTIISNILMAGFYQSEMVSYSLQELKEKYGVKPAPPYNQSILKEGCKTAQADMNNFSLYEFEDTGFTTHFYCKEKEKVSIWLNKNYFSSQSEAILRQFIYKGISLPSTNPSKKYYAKIVAPILSVPLLANASLIYLLQDASPFFMIGSSFLIETIGMGTLVGMCWGKDSYLQKKIKENHDFLALKNTYKLLLKEKRSEDITNCLTDYLKWDLKEQMRNNITGFVTTSDTFDSLYSYVVHKGRSIGLPKEELDHQLANASSEIFQENHYRNLVSIPINE